MKGDTMEDSRIIELFWQRDQRAIEELENKYGRLCTEVARNIVGNLRDAEEIVNELYLSVWKSIPPEKPQFFRAYICKIVKNIAIMRIRHNKAQKRGKDNVVSINELEDILTKGNVTEQLVDGNLLAKYISDYLRSIKKYQRDMFIGRYWYNYSIKELAKMFNVSEGSIKTSLHRSRAGLKKYLEGKGVEL